MTVRFLTALLLLASPVFVHAEEAVVAPAEVAKKQDKPKPPPADWDKMFKAHWASRVALFKKDNLAIKKETPANVVMLGDSITEGFNVAKHFPGQPVINRGIGADIIGNALPPTDPRGILRRLDCSVFDCAPTDVFILIGTNDLAIMHSVDTIEAGYREMVGSIRKQLPKLRIHVQSVLPTSGQFDSRNASILQLNVRLKKLATEFSCDFVDLHPLMCDAAGKLKAEFTKDGLHLLEPGYAVWRDELKRVMKWQ